MTINQIAQMAGVSIGTVDRVVHKRGRVAPETARRVEMVIAQADYRINPLARQLKMQKKYRVGVVLPLLDSESGYWRQVYEGMKKAETELLPFSVELELSEFDRTHSESCLQSALHVAEVSDALVIAPLVPEECKTLLRQRPNIPCVFIDSALPHTSPEAVFAQDPFKGGYTAGRVMNLLAPKARQLVTFQMHSAAFNSRERSRGFLEYFAPRPKIKVTEILYTKEHTDEGFTLFLEDFFTIYDGIDGVFVVNEAVHKIGSYLLKKNLKKHIAVVGYDLIAKNRQGLLDGSIDCIISQQPEFQGYTSIYGLYRKVLLRQEIDTTHIPIDIFFRENLPDLDRL